MNRSICISALLLATACGGGGLSEDDVIDLPAGDATGVLHAGDWSLETLTTSCAGDCEGSIDGFGFSVCDVGDRNDMTADVTQDDGAISFDVPDSEFVSRLDGGVWQSGAFVVGGQRTQQGGQLTILTRADGTLDGDALTGTASLRIEGAGAACDVEVDLDGER